MTEGVATGIPSNGGTPFKADLRRIANGTGSQEAVDFAEKLLATPSSELRFTPEQVKNLDEYQRAGVMHPFTCPHRGDGKHEFDYGVDHGALVPTVRGWICPCCDYTQDWAHDFMLDGSAVKNDPMAAFRARSATAPTTELESVVGEAAQPALDRIPCGDVGECPDRDQCDEAGACLHYMGVLNRLDSTNSKSTR